MGTFLGYDSFRAAYGTAVDENGDPIISAAWQTGLQNAVQVGSILGLYLNGWISDKIGYRKTMLGSLVLMVAFIFMPFFAKNIQTILAGAFLQGIPWGVFQTLTVTYASEVMPTNLRAYLTTYVNLCWVLGQLTAAGVIRGCLNIEGQWSYRIPFAIQWIWPVPIFIGAWLAPESPWWLVRKGRYEDARRSLQGLTSPTPSIPFDVDGQLAMIRSTNELEKAMSEGTSYLYCFKGADLRRTEIASMAWVAQAFCGAVLMGYSVQVYREAGLSEENALNLNIGQYTMGAAGTIGSWFLMRRIGRRTLYLYGLGILCVLLLIVGGLGIISDTNVGAQWGVGSIILVYTFVYDITIGPVCYSLVAEIPSTRLKIKTVVLARNFYNMGGIVNNIIMPKMLGPNDWNWGAKSGFFWAGACALLALWTFFRLPEPKDRTYGELDVLFENKVSARKFHKTRVDQFAGDHTQIVADDTKGDIEMHTVETKFDDSLRQRHASVAEL